MIFPQKQNKNRKLLAQLKIKHYICITKDKNKHGKRIRKI